ncbi:universal stress protein [Rhizobium etli]|nr:universal stress protein [Rhizobium etli]
MDLIVLGLHHASSQDVFVGTKAEHIACNSVVPVLVVKDKLAGSYHTVVSATEFSPCSARALPMGLELATDADFFLLHVFETPFPGRIKLNAEQLAEYERPLVEEFQHEAQKAMDAFLKEHGHCEASVTPKLERNETENGISKILLEQDARSSRPWHSLEKSHRCKPYR